MTWYLISFDDGDMDFPEEDFEAVSAAAHRFVDEARAAGVWVVGGGLTSYLEMSVVDVDGTITEGPSRPTKGHMGGFSILDVSSREEAQAWAAKIAVACRCAQEVREIMEDPSAR